MPLAAPGVVTLVFAENVLVQNHVGAQQRVQKEIPFFRIVAASEIGCEAGM